MATKRKKMKMITLEQMKDRDIGKIGTEERDRYEFDIKFKNNRYVKYECECFNFLLKNIERFE